MVKKVVIANTQVPFVSGGAEFLAEKLRKKIIEYGHKAEIVRIPFKWYPLERISEHILACRLLDLTQASGEDIDILIAHKFPTYCIKHPNKVLWLFHQFRQAYDLWGTIYQEIPSTLEGLKIRDMVIQSDNTFLKEAKKIYTNSKIVSKRLKDFNDIDSTPLYPPLENPEAFYCEGYGDYIFYPSRVNSIKRQALAIESMKYVKTGAKLMIAGKSDADNYMDELKSTIIRNGLEGKVELMGEISEDEKIRFFAGALGCIYIPYNEDSYGFVTLESFYSKKPVITCTDSGGTDEIVDDGLNGYIVPSEPKAIAQAIDDLYSKKEKAKKLGMAGYDKLISLNITWDNVIEALIG
jgi:glycosyltransferase involved in cell wall biosynthesis